MRKRIARSRVRFPNKNAVVISLQSQSRSARRRHDSSAICGSSVKGEGCHHATIFNIPGPQRDTLQSNEHVTTIQESNLTGSAWKSDCVILGWKMFDNDSFRRYQRSTSTVWAETKHIFLNLFINQFSCDG